MDANHNLYDLVRRAAAAQEGRPALIGTGGRGLSYGALDEQSGRLARLLASQLDPGERVAALVEKSASGLLLYLACLRAGVVYLPLNPACATAEVELLLDDARPAMLVCRAGRAAELGPAAERCGVRRVLTLEAEGGGTLPQASAELAAAQEPVVVQPADAAAMLYTSGTTGRPKGALLSHGALAANARALNEAWDWQPDDRLLHVLPLFHVHGLFVACHCALLGGSSIVLLPRFDASAVIEQLPRCTVLMGVPTHYARLLGVSTFDRSHCHGMRLFTCGSAPLPPGIFAEFGARTGQWPVERYGLTETLINTSNRPQRPKAGAVGRPLRGVELRVVADHGELAAEGEVGEIEVRGRSLFGGYWRRPPGEEWRGDGFFRTGDLGRLDDEGELSIVGRAKDLVISGGLNVYPREVEVALDEIDGVAESAVIGLPDRDWGERVVAAVVTEPDRPRPDPGALIAALRSRLAAYKVPKAVFFLGQLPRNAMGKVDKAALRAEVGSSRQTRG